MPGYEMPGYDGSSGYEGGYKVQDVRVDGYGV